MVFGIFLLILFALHCWGFWWIFTLYSGRCRSARDCMVKIGCVAIVSAVVVFVEVKEFAVPLAAIKYLFK